MTRTIFIAGYGGQGIMLAGNLLAAAGMLDGHEICYFPAYGVEKRGGAACCTVTIADTVIGSPVVDRPQAALLLNQEACDLYFEKVEPRGFCLLNGSLAKPAKGRDDLSLLSLPLHELALQLGDIRLVNMIAVGACARRTGSVTMTSLAAALARVLPERNHQLIPLNLRALELGAAESG